MKLRTPITRASTLPHDRIPIAARLVCPLWPADQEPPVPRSKAEPSGETQQMVEVDASSEKEILRL
jgi:hypothetical protein